MKYDSNSRKERNVKAFARPMPGDYWNEMFSPYFVVLECLDNGNYIVCDKTKSCSSDTWTWDLEKAIEVSIGYFDCVRYKSMDGFVADVSAKPHTWAVEAWEEMKKPYVPKSMVVADFATVMSQGV